MPRRLPSGKWQGVVRVGTRRVTQAHDLRSQAKAWEEQQRVLLRRGDWRDPRLARMLFEDWLARWEAARHIEPETAVADHRTILKHVLPRWRGMPLGAIGRLEVQAWVTGMTKSGLGFATVTKAYGHFASCMLAAADEDLIGRTPCRKITLPPPPPRRLAWWEPAEVGLIVGRLDEPHATIACLMSWCGLRWEEAAALPADAVNWIRREVTVRQVVTSARRIKPYAKRAASHRTVRMEGPVADRLLPAWEAAVAARGSSGLLFVAAGRRPLLNKTWGEHWRRRIRDGRMPGRGKALNPLPVRYDTPHVLRHSGASWLVQGGVPLADVSRWLGHEPNSPATVVYAHLCPERSNATVAEALAKLVDGGSGEARSV
jgi:integrase